ncbi:MAG: NUDIX domain-containing protein, partial [Deltaproteobacteria bacterium]|nr:NUDIX domain-containing protein [Deltaproteobacteria bacterium]
HYNNPKLVVGCIPVWEDRILFCRRAIEPRYGKWTIPAGYLETGETVEEGALRETNEEAGARIEFIEPYAIYNIAFIGQVYLIFRGRLMNGAFKSGLESLETRLFGKDEIPWDHRAFTVIREVLHRYLKDCSRGAFPFHISRIETDGKV